MVSKIRVFVVYLTVTESVHCEVHSEEIKEYPSSGTEILFDELPNSQDQHENRYVEICMENSVKLSFSLFLRA